MVSKISPFFMAGLLIVSYAANAEPKKQRLTPVLSLKNHALMVCIATGLGPGEASEKAAAAAREYMEQGAFPIEAYTQAASLAKSYLSRDYKNIYGDDLVFIKCMDFYNGPELSRVVAKYSMQK